MREEFNNGVPMEEILKPYLDAVFGEVDNDSTALHKENRRTVACKSNSHFAKNEFTQFRQKESRMEW